MVLDDFKSSRIPSPFHGFAFECFPPNCATLTATPMSSCTASGNSKQIVLCRPDPKQRLFARDPRPSRHSIIPVLGYKVQNSVSLRNQQSTEEPTPDASEASRVRPTAPSSGWTPAWPRARTGVWHCAGFAPNINQTRSSSRAGLLPPSPLITVRGSFPPHGSSLSNACRTRRGNECDVETILIRRRLRNPTPRTKARPSRTERSNLSRHGCNHEFAAQSTPSTQGHKDARPSEP